jgi:hypothetical protein
MVALDLVQSVRDLVKDLLGARVGGGHGLLEGGLLYSHRG